MKRFLAALLAALGLMGTLSGCSLNLAASPEDLYTLPQLPAEYAELNHSIRQLIEAGAEYAAPTAGTNLQPLQLVDLDGDGREEILTFRADEQGAGTADYYAWTGDGTLAPAGVARLSMTMAELSAGQVLSGTLRGGEPAVFATGVSDSRIQVTDILALRQGELGNLTVSDSTGVSREIYRYLGLFPTDIDGDGVTELPAPLGLTAYGDEPGSRIDWRSFDAQGLSESALNTYHAPADGWYLDLPEDWGETLSVTAEGSGTEVSTSGGRST